MTRTHTFGLLFLLWFLTFFGAFFIAANTAPTDFGMTRGLNRITLFFEIQIGAAFLALIVWHLGRAFPKGSRNRRLSRVPILLALLEVLAIVALILVVNFRDPAPVPPTTGGTPTAPAAVVKPVDN